jgi:hypothetical protein
MTRWLIIAALGLAGAAAACDVRPDTLGAGPSASSQGDDDDDDDSTTTKKKTKKTDTTPAPTATTVADAGPPPAPSPFKGDSAFQSLAPDTDSSDHHFSDTNAGKDCMGCHGEGQGAPQFAFGGTLYADKSGTTGVPNAEVRIIDSTGAEVAHTSTDSAGNFWLLSSSVKIPPGSRVGVRDGTTEKAMNGTIAVGACNQTGCHNKAMPLFLGN